MVTDPKGETDFRVLVTHALDVITILDARGGIRYASPSLEQTLGYSTEEAARLSVFDLIHPDDQPEARETFARVTRTPGATLTVEFRYRHRDGRWLVMESCAKNLLDDPRLGGVLVNSRDVSKRVEAERALQQMRDHLQDQVEARTADLQRANARLQQEVEERRRAQAEQQQAEQALRQQDEHFRLLFESNPLPMWVYDVETLAFLEVNDAAIQSYGYSREDFLGMRITDIRPDEDVPALLEDVRSERPALQQRTPWRHARKDGSVIAVEITSHTITVQGRRAALVVATDVTERHESRQRLDFLYRTMSALLTDALDHPKSLHGLTEAVVPALADWCAVHVLGDDGGVERVAFTHTGSSDTALTVARQHPSPITLDAQVGPGRVLRTGEVELYPEIPDYLLTEIAQDDEHLERLRSLGMTSALIVPLVARGRTLGALTLATAESGRRYGPDDLDLAKDLAHRAGLVIDSAQLFEAEQHARAALEQRVRERTAELETANQELESFSYSVSHDLRSPLRAIEGFTRILTERHASELDPKARDYLARVRDNALRMDQLIDDLLQFSRLSRKEMQTQTVQPADLVRQVLEELDPLPDDREIEIEIGDLPACEADALLLRQVYVNLISNALKFSQYRSPAVVRVGAEQRGGVPVYFVSDNGTGFDMRYADKLFGVFQRLHRAEDFEGTGVGLAIVQRVVHRHGGRVWAEATPDEGATFFFTLQPPVA